MIDLDQLAYSYDAGKPRFRAIIDWKHGTKSQTSTFRSTDQSFIVQAELARTLDIAFFLVVTYLDESCPIPMLYVVPCNEKARQTFDELERTEPGIWMSVYDYARFEHRIRKTPFNDSETDRDGRTLRELSRETTTYTLPTIEI